jgi:hypothetical protein
LWPAGGAVPTLRQQSDVEAAVGRAAAAAGEDAIDGARSDGAALPADGAVTLAFDLCDRLGARGPAVTT